MKIRILLVVCVAWVLSMPVSAQELLADTQGTTEYALDAMTRDTLDRKVDSIMSHVKQSARQHQPTPELLPAIQGLAEALPCSSQTRALKLQARQLYHTLSNSSDPAEREKLTAQLSAIVGQIERDPEYAQALQYIKFRLAPPLALPDFGVPLAQTPPANSAVPMSTSGSGIPINQLQIGDILLWEDRSGGLRDHLFSWTYARTFTHAAVYLGDVGIGGPKGERRTYEAENPTLGVRTEKFDGRWTRSGLHVAIGHVNGLATLTRFSMLLYYYGMLGDNGRTPYHIWPPWDKHWLNNGLYCSQLPWLVYSGRVDLDSNDFGYDLWFAIHNFYEPLAFLIARDAVFPDEIRASSNITWYYDKINP